jgi:hypothetical protein
VVMLMQMASAGRETANNDRYEQKQRATHLVKSRSTFLTARHSLLRALRHPHAQPTRTSDLHADEMRGCGGMSWVQR